MNVCIPTALLSGASQISDMKKTLPTTPSSPRRPAGPGWSGSITGDAVRADKQLGCSTVLLLYLPCCLPTPAEKSNPVWSMTPTSNVSYILGRKPGSTCDIPYGAVTTPGRTSGSISIEEEGKTARKRRLRKYVVETFPYTGASLGFISRTTSSEIGARVCMIPREIRNRYFE